MSAIWRFFRLEFLEFLCFLPTLFSCVLFCPDVIDIGTENSYNP